jgi:hypothetical protein
MNRRWTYGLALLACLVGRPSAAQALLPYDDFAAGRIDPAKWLTTPICSSNGYDCAREVKINHLRLAVQSYGTASTDSGTTVDTSQLLFRNPNAIDTIRVRLKVDSFSSAACPANNEAAHPQLVMSGAFFNAGSGAPQDDVFAFFIVERRTDDPSIPATSLRVGAFMSIGDTFFNNVLLGTLEVGEPATATLEWNRQSHRFVVRIVKTVTIPQVVEATLPYSQADNLPPASPMKALQVNTFTPNCTTVQSFSAMEARLDNIRVNASAVR